MATHQGFAGLAPRVSVRTLTNRPDGSARNCWAATVASLEQHGDTVRVRLAGPIAAFADVTPLAVAELGLEPGADVWAAVKATETTVYPA